MKIKKSIPVIVASMLLGVAVTGCSNGDKPTTGTPTTSVVTSTTPNTESPSTATPTTPTPSTASPTTPTPTTPTIPEGAQEIGFGEENKGTLPENQYAYWNDQWWCGSSVTINRAYVLDGTLLVDYEYHKDSTTDWGLQIFYDNTTLEAGKTYVLTLKINSEKPVKAKVNGEAFNLVAGDNEIEVTYVKTPRDQGSISIQLDKAADLKNVITISNSSWELTAGKLSAPVGIVLAEEPSDGSKVIQFAAVDGAAGYIVVYYDDLTGEEVTREEISQPGSKLTAILEDGTYRVKVIAKGDGTTGLNSDPSSQYATLTIGEIAKPDPDVKIEVNFGNEADSPANTMIYWNDNWYGENSSSVTVNKAYYLNDEYVFDYTYAADSKTDWGFQLFYRNTTLVSGKEYVLTFDINSSDACNVKVNDKSFSLVEGDNEIEVTYTEGLGISSLDMQLDKSEDLNNVVKIKNLKWEPVQQTQPSNPTKLSNVVGGVLNSIPGDKYIFACAPVENASGYHIQFLDSSNDVKAEQDIANGGEVTCISELAAGAYKAQVKAVGAGNYQDSDYVVIKDNFVISDENDNQEGNKGDDKPIISEGESIAIDGSRTKVEGAGIFVYLMDKPNISLDDFTITAISFESSAYEYAKDNMMKDPRKDKYNKDTGELYFIVAQGFDSGFTFIVNITYTIDSTIYTQNITIVDNAYQPNGFPSITNAAASDLMPSANGESTSDKYFLNGNVLKITDETNGAFSFVDLEGNGIDVTSSSLLDTTYANMTNKLNRRDDVVVYGAISNKDGKSVINSAIIVSINRVAQEETFKLISEVISADTCNDYSKAADYRNRYNALSTDKQNIFDSIVINCKANKDDTSLSETVSLGDKLAYMETLIATDTATKKEASLLNSFVSSNNVSIILVVGLLGLAAVAGYYFLNKKKYC